MKYYIREVLKNLSISGLIAVFPAFSPARAATLDDFLKSKIASMTVEEKAGQLFIVGFPNSYVDTEYMNFLSQYKPGAFIIFKRNIKSVEQITNLNSTLYSASYKYSRLPPLIAIDQEGGAVSRLPLDPAQPNALALGHTHSPFLSEEMGYQTGLFLREVGFNMNLAPVLDVSDPFVTSFIGPRSFGSNAKTVADLGTAYSKGLMRTNVLPTAKHFPGTGNTNGDPHSVVVTNSNSLASLQNRDLIPFQAYAGLGSNTAMMLSHSVFPSLDPDNEPASFSPKISTDLVRNVLKFQGMLITDDLQMKGSKQLLRAEVAALKALKAGADVVMMSWSISDQKKAISLTAQAIRTGDIPEQLLHAKLKRILTVKAFANVYKRDPQFRPVKYNGLLTSINYTKLENDILAVNFFSNLIPKTFAKKQEILRTPATIEKICALSPSNEFLRSFASKKRANVDTFLINRDSQSKDILKWTKSKNCNGLIFAVSGPSSAELVSKLPHIIKNNIVLINLGVPSLIKDELNYKKIIQLYFNHKNSGKKVAENLEQILGTN